MVKGFYLISDFHVDMNLLDDPPHVDGVILHHVNENKRERTIKRIFNWLPIPRDRLLVFAGDTANSAEAAAMVWQEAAERVRRVLVLSGNHEYYMPRFRSISEVDAHIRLEVAKTENIVLLELGTEFYEDGILYLGCTGWYNWDAVPELDMREERACWQNNSSDSRMPVWDQGWPDVLARRHTEWLVQAVEAAQTRPEVKQIVILTHTVPRVEFLVPKGHQWYDLNGSYANTLMDQVVLADTGKKIAVWCYGHTHYQGDAVLDGIRYVCNPRGYRGEPHASAWWKPKWIALDSGLTEEGQSDIIPDLNSSTEGTSQS